MQINFFTNNCKSVSKKSKFGLCDDPPPATNPAYIDEDDDSKWIGIVENNHKKEIEFIAIDACVNIRKSNGKMESRCDGLLSHDNHLIFVELKSRASGQWLKKGREQLTVTINTFKSHYDINQYDDVSAHVCNSLKPQSHTGQATNIQRFFDETGLILKGERVIKIE